VAFILNLFNPFPSHVPPFSFSAARSRAVSADLLGDTSRRLLAACGAAGGDRFVVDIEDGAGYPEPVLLLLLVMSGKLSRDTELIEAPAPGGNPSPSTPRPVDISW